jgi:hypothetical protein
MKKTIALSVLIFSFSSVASSLIKTHDGKVARCQSSLDLAEQALSGVYRPLKIVKKERESIITLEFLKCTNSKGIYQFTRDHSFEERTKSVTNYGTPDLAKVNISIQRNEISLIAFNGAGELIDNAPLTKNPDGTYTARVSMDAPNLDDSPTGKKSLEFAVRSIFTLYETDNGKEIDSGYENLGSYRLIVK